MKVFILTINEDTTIYCVHLDDALQNIRNVMEDEEFSCNEPNSFDIETREMTDEEFQALPEWDGEY